MRIVQLAVFAFIFLEIRRLFVTTDNVNNHIELTIFIWYTQIVTVYFERLRYKFESEEIEMVIAGIVAGGTGSRMGQNMMPKQFLELAKKPIVIHTIEKFMASPSIDAIVVGVHPEWEHVMRDLVKKYFHDDERIVITVGGATRNDTIKNIVDAAKENFKADNDTVLVTHDAVRPFVSLKIIEENVIAAEQYGICDTVIGATDTIVQSENGQYITDIPVRSQMYQGQTPQSFKIGLFDEVFGGMSKEELEIVTDACKMFHLRGHKVQLVQGDVSNFKITYPFELKMARTIVEEGCNND